MSLLTLLRRDRQTRPLAPEPEIVEDTFRPAAKTPPPADNIVVLSQGIDLVFHEEHKWSIRGTKALRETVMRLPGDSTVITQMPMRAAELRSLKNEHVWSSTHADPKFAIEQKGSAVTSLFIRSVIIVESHGAQKRISINPGASCDVVIISTDYLDDVCIRYDCHAMQNPHENCTWLAYKEVLSSIFQVRKNFPRFVPTDEQIDDILAGKPLPAEHINTVELDLRAEIQKMGATAH